MSLSITYYDTNILARVLFDEVENATGIPVQQQMLTSGELF